MVARRRGLRQDVSRCRTPRCPPLSRRARGRPPRRLLAGCAAALLLASGTARADGLRFVGDLPYAPHVLVDLTDDQVQEIQRANGSGELGARLETGGRVHLLVPGFVEGGIGPRHRAWFILEYRGGLLVAAAGLTDWGGAGTTYEWPTAADE